MSAELLTLVAVSCRLCESVRACATIRACLGGIRCSKLHAECSLQLLTAAPWLPVRFGCCFVLTLVATSLLTVSSSTPTKWRRTFEAATSSALSENNIIKVRNRNLNARFSRPRHAHDSRQENAQSIILVRLKAAMRRPRMAGFTFSSPTVAGLWGRPAGPRGCGRLPLSGGPVRVTVSTGTAGVGRGWVTRPIQRKRRMRTVLAEARKSKLAVPVAPSWDGPRRASSSAGTWGPVRGL
jgi:hypothetical protein